MNKTKGSLKTFTAYIVVIIMMLLVVFPNKIYAAKSSHKMVAFKTSNGNYLCAENGGGSTLTANRDKVGEWETFQLIDLGKGNVALKGYNGDYIRVSDKEENVYVDSHKVEKRSTFQLIALEDQKIALKTHDKKYLCAENGGGGKVVADRKEIGDWESFELIEISNNDRDYDVCNLTATADDKSVTFTWSKPSNTKNIIGYNLYRGTASGKQASTPVTDFPIERTTYTDPNLESGKTYYYILKAVYKDKTEGSASNEVAVSLRSRITLSAQVEEEGIHLYWDKPGDASNIIGYNLYRGANWGKQSNTPITDFPIDKRDYIDENVEDNRTYYYILKPVYKDKTLGMASNEVSIKYTSNQKTIILQVGSKYMIVDGRRTEIDPGKGTTMIIKNGRAFLPIRAVIEAMDGEVEWDSYSKKATIYLENDEIQLWVGSKMARINGVNKESDVAPYISESGRTMLPLRFIVENLGFEADWDGITQKVAIKTK